MMLEIVLCGLVAAAPGQNAAVELEPGDTLVLDDLGGTVHVEGGEHDTLAVSDDHGNPMDFDVARSGDNLVLQLRDVKGQERPKELHIDVPAWLSVRLSGHRFEAHIAGLQGAATIETVEGDLFLSRLAGEVTASSIQGRIAADRLTGTATLRSVQDDLQVRDSSAELNVETVQGDIEFTGAESPRIATRTTSGDIEFRGRITGQGIYAFRSHNGDIVLRLTPPVHVHGTVMTYEGDFESDFPLHATTYRSGEPISFTIGQGHSQVIVEAFDGDIEFRAHESD